METIEQLKQENEKLQERLNNAAKFFREQKAQIEKLTNELNAYQNSDEKKSEIVVQSHSDEEYDEVVKQYNDMSKSAKELLEVNTQLTKENETLSLQLNEYELKLQEAEKKNIDIFTQYDELTKKHNGINNELEKTLIEVAKLNSDNDALRESDKKFREAYNDAQQQLSEYKKESDDEIKRLNETISESVKVYNELTKQNETINSIAKEYQKQNDEYKEFTNKLIALTETLPQYGKHVLSNSVLELDQQDKQQKHIKQSYSNSRIGGEFMSDAKGMNI